MYPAQSSLPAVEGNAALHQIGVQAVAFEFALTPRTPKATALIVNGLDVDFENPGQLGLVKLH
jgi:hypothetical protein